MPICPVTKKWDFTFSPIFILRPFGEGRANFNTWDLTSAYMYMPVKFYPDPLRFSGVIPENPICSDYIVRWMHAYA